MIDLGSADPAPASPHTHFRLDIQGLRGVAVLLVVLFHAGLALPGGFIGVDVFFVISGFVITGMLTRELGDSGSVRLREFYVRRVRRLLPALAVLVLATLVATALIGSPEQLATTAGTAIAAVFFVANLYLLRSPTGYFDQPEETNPLLHLWSLSVEEQFYLVLPGALFLVWRLAQRGTRWRPQTTVAVVVAAGSALSLLACWAFSTERGPAMFDDQLRVAFYSAPTRVWEFGAGALLALAGVGLHRLRPHLATIVAVVGAALVFGAALRFDDTTVFPGTAALLPVGGTFLVILAGVTANPVSRALAWRPLVWVGDLSYSWYLWHWPAIVLAGVAWPESSAAPLIAAALSLLPAWLVFRYLETPIRTNRAIVGRRAVRLAGVCIGVPALLGGALALAASGHWGMDELRPVPDTARARAHGCHAGRGSSAEWPAARCTYQVDGAKGTVFLTGDSHAISLADAFTGRDAKPGRAGTESVAADLQHAVAVSTRSACSFLAPSPEEQRPCRRWQQATADHILETRPELVVIANNENEVDGDDPEAIAAWKERLESVVSDFEAAGIPVLIVENVPVYPYDPVMTRSLLFPDGRVPTFTAEELEEQRGPTRTANAEIAAAHDSVSLFDPVPSLCTDICMPRDESVWLYYDRGHITPAASMRVRSSLTRAVEERLG